MIIIFSFIQNLKLEMIVFQGYYFNKINKFNTMIGSTMTCKKEFVQVLVYSFHSCMFNTKIWLHIIGVLHLTLLPVTVTYLMQKNWLHIIGVLNLTLLPYTVTCLIQKKWLEVLHFLNCSIYTIIKNTVTHHPLLHTFYPGMT